MKRSFWVFYTLACLLGSIVGFLGSCFQLSIRWIEQFFLHVESFKILVSILASLGLSLLAWLSVKYIAPEAAGSGVQEIEGALLHQRRLHWQRLLPVKFFGGIAAISAQLVLGREGPTIHLGGALGEMLGEGFRLLRAERDILVAAGAAAGLAVAFNAPIAAVLFILEEVREAFNVSFVGLKTAAISCVVATIVLQGMLGNVVEIPMATFSMPPLSSLGLFMIFGILLSLLAWVMNVALVNTVRVVKPWRTSRTLLFVCIFSVMVGVLVIDAPLLVGGGYKIFDQALTLQLSGSWLVVLIIGRLILGLGSYAMGVPGGIFAPMLAVGTLVGLLFANLLGFALSDLGVTTGMLVLAGMSGLFAAVVRAPLTGVMLVVEMTQNYALILPLMVTCLTASTMMQWMKQAPIYTQLLRS